MDEGLLIRVIKGITTRSYQAYAEAIPKAFGLSSSTVSRRFIKASAQKLKQFRERSSTLFSPPYNFKTASQHLSTAETINLKCVYEWLNETPRATTRTHPSLLWPYRIRQ